MEGLDVEPNRLTYGVSLAEKLFRHALSQNGHHRVVQHVPCEMNVPDPMVWLRTDSYSGVTPRTSAKVSFPRAETCPEMADGLLSGATAATDGAVSGVQQRVRVVHGQRLGTV